MVLLPVLAVPKSGDVEHEVDLGLDLDSFAVDLAAQALRVDELVDPRQVGPEKPSRALAIVRAVAQAKYSQMLRRSREVGVAERSMMVFICWEP